MRVHKEYVVRRVDRGENSQIAMAYEDRRELSDNILEKIWKLMSLIEI